MPVLALALVVESRAAFRISGDVPGIAVRLVAVGHFGGLILAAYVELLAFNVLSGSVEGTRGERSLANAAVAIVVSATLFSPAITLFFVIFAGSYVRLRTMIMRARLRRLQVRIWVIRRRFARESLAVLCDMEKFVDRLYPNIAAARDPDSGLTQAQREESIEASNQVLARYRGFELVFQDRENTLAQLAREARQHRKERLTELHRASDLILRTVVKNFTLAGGDSRPTPEQ